EFFMMNSNERKTEFAEGGKQYEWLEEELKKSDAKWKFVAMHHAPYSTDENDYGNAYKGKEKYGDTYVKQLIPVFEKYGVDIVFFGHLHSYSRMGPVKSESISQKEGVWYIQSGGAGGNLEDFGPTRAWFSEKVFAGHHYCLINIEGGKLVFKMYDLEGRLRDFMELEKGE
ncbi:MAG: metallophosphoesterase, partial [Bacteroidota bacterium]